ncbi:MAG: carboxypeptidase regulatory-like domain-containing protein [Pyrinomonadaceae bacterium]|nr:carboxypeptidase regulatory-like domain-containing protein [Pyrinomonadaceae bacterium]
MWRVISLVALCLVCLSLTQAQTVLENETSVIFNEKTADVSLVVQNLDKSFAGKIELELLNNEDKKIAEASQNFKIKRGKESYKLSMPLGDLLEKVDSEVAWYRLHYRVGNTQGFISLSEIVKDVFELRVAAAEKISVGMNYRVRVRAIHPLTKMPIENVKVDANLKLDLDTEADEDELKLNAKGETDDDGFAVLDFKIPEKIKLDYDGDLKVKGRKNAIIREVEEDLNTNENKSSVFLTTDKPIYQPAQDFKVRGLYFDANNNVVTDSELEFSIKDEDDTVLYREKVKTSEFGIASISWKIPDNAKLGNYRVEVENENGDDVAQQSFKVSRYDLPNFSVTAKPDKTFYLPTDKQAEVTVNADYLFGKPVTQGRVRVVQESNRHWNWREQKYDVEEKQTFEGETDKDGKYIAKVDLSEAINDLQRNNWQRFTDLNFAAYYTDLTTNKTEQRRFDIRVSKEPIHVYLIRSDYRQEFRLPITAYVSTFYADGTPAVCDVDLKINQKPITKLKTNSLGAGRTEFTLDEKFFEGSYYNFEISARDQKGENGTFSENMYYYKTDSLKISADKTIFKPGESVKVNLLSTKKDALVYVDIVQNWSTLATYFVNLKDGKGELKIPYNPNFKGDLAISAYIDSDSNDYYYYDYGLIKASRGIIYPIQQNLKLDAQFSAAEYRPNEEAKVNFSVLNSVGKTVQSALGVVVFDKAVEERARTDAEFGSYFSRFYSLLGYQRSFGGITLKDLNELNLSKPVSPEIQLAAEIMLADYYYYPRIYRSRKWESDVKSVYAPFFKKQFEPIEKVLKAQFEKNYTHPTDEASLRKILQENGLSFENIRDPWGNNYQPVFSISQTQDIVTWKTAGVDKKFDTADDFTVSTSSFSYFLSIGEKINKAVWEYHKRTGKFIRDAETFSAELAKQDLDASQIKDRWNHDYRVTFEISDRNYLIRFYSYGPNGYYEPGNYNTDDFTVWTSAIDYFAETEKEINRILSQTVNVGKKPFPKDDIEFKQILKDNGLDFAKILDGWGNPVYLTSRKENRYADKVVIENGKQKITPVTQELQTFTIRSQGTGGLTHFDLATFSSVITEQSKDTLYKKAEIKNIAYSNSNGAIRGTVVDPNGAIIAGATVTATNQDDTTKTYSATTNDSGVFLLENLLSGKYKVEVYARGFQKSVYSDIQVRSMNLVEMNVSLNVGSVAATVDVTSNAVTIESSSSSLSTTVNSRQVQNLPLNGRNVANLLSLQPGVTVNGARQRNNNVTLDGVDVNDPTKSENSTPRLREYFPETLVWSPELLTDKNGKAELKFKLADNITTWKLYSIASTKNGKIGIAEKEVRAFQPFFVDLDPPKFLTEGDEIYLPTQVRNYTETKQKVGVTMKQADWFSLLTPELQKIEVPSGDSGIAVFGFKTISAIKGGKQRVTAIAQKTSDAIEKPVTVRPNGEEIVKTDSKLFNNSASFEVDFPANALPRTPKAELKIYPNLFSHVAESVEGLLQRPYGCGEQTISSTYPNLMLLKFIKEDNKLRATAERYLQKGYERLLGYQVSDGGFSYWGGKDSSDVALTAYAIRFLNDAKTFIKVDETVIKKATDYLVNQQQTDGSFTKKYYWESSTDSNRTKLFTSYVARTLAMQIGGNATIKERVSTQSNDTLPDGRVSALAKALEYLKKRNDEIDEPYALALYGLASLDAGNIEAANKTAQLLAKMAIPEDNAVYWKLETNTPFYGWGTAGRVETTALVVQLLLKTKTNQDLVSRGMLFLLKNKDRYGVWYSTQTTINVLDTFLATLSTEKTAETQTLQVLLNGENLQNITVPPDQITPITVDLTNKLDAKTNRVEVKGSSSSPLMSQIVSAHYIDWKDSEASGKNTNQSRQLRLDYKCDKQNAEIMQEVNCSAEAERVGFQGYGMLLAEIGIPPGADVSRESLEEALKNDWSLSRYDILPDRIIFYMWSKAGGTKINFKFKPRYGMKALTPASIVYDYYNEEAKAIVAPLKFEVK